MIEKTINGRKWTRRNRLKSFSLWNADYYSPDGDCIMLYINEDNFELSCFSGIGNSVITIDKADFSALQNKVNLDFTESFEIQCLKIADYFCRIFCEYLES